MHAHENVLRLIVGNKSDLEEKRLIPASNGQQLGQDYNMKFFETSAKTGENIEEVIKFLILLILKGFPSINPWSEYYDRKRRNRCPRSIRYSC